MPSGSDRPVEPPCPETRRTPCVRATLGPRQRLRRSADFREAYDQDRRRHGKLMVLFLRTAPDASLRLGVVASKRVGNAVERARAKRRLREAFRRLRGALAPSEPVDVVLVARRPLLAAPWTDVTGELRRLARRAGLLPPPPPAQ